MGSGRGATSVLQDRLDLGPQEATGANGRCSGKESLELGPEGGEGMTDAGGEVGSVVTPRPEPQICC